MRLFHFRRMLLSRVRYHSSSSRNCFRHVENHVPKYRDTPRMTEFSFSMTLASRLWLRVVKSRSRFLKLSTDFARIFTDHELTSKPRKVKPSRNVVTRVLVGLSDRPSGAKHCSTCCRASFA